MGKPEASILEVQESRCNVEDSEIESEVKNGNLAGNSRASFLAASGVVRSRPFSNSENTEDSQVDNQARVNSPAQVAAFDTQSHVTATCGKKEETPIASNQLRGKDLIDWAIGNYTVDPVQNSKNRWKIRLRCRKVGCEHADHLKIKTVSFMSDSGYKSAIRGAKKHASWKKQIIAENARALRKSN